MEKCLSLVIQKYEIKKTQSFASKRQCEEIATVLYQLKFNQPPLFS